MFYRVVRQLRELKVFVALTNRVSQKLDVLHELQTLCHKSDHSTFAGSLLCPGFLVL